MFLKTKIALSFLGVVLYGETSWYDRKLEGWYYFEELEQGRDEGCLKPTLEEAEAILAVEQKNLRQLLSLALLDPSMENVEAYIRAQKRWIDQSAQFATTWGKVLLEKPFLGDFLHNPTTSYGILARRDFELQRRKELLQTLSKTHFLLFFFRGKEPFSGKAAEAAKLFASLNQWKIKAVSLDGVGAESIAEYELDRGISQYVSVPNTPSFYVVDPQENTMIPVGAGLVSVSDIEQNIELQFLKKDSYE